MERVQVASRRLAEDTGDRVAGLWALVETGGMTLDRFRALAAAVIVRANVRGVALADLGLTAEVMRQLGRPSSPLGLRPTPVQVDRDRVVRDIDRILDNAPEAADSPEALTSSRQAQLHRLGRSEPLLTVATAVTAGMVARRAHGWTRMLSGTSCPLCTRWADGVVRPPTVRMGRHVGCDCIQAPVFTQ